MLGDVFFPGDNEDAKFMESLAVFGAAFVMRPIGGLAVGDCLRAPRAGDLTHVLGYLGDQIGRKPA